MYVEKLTREQIDEFVRKHLKEDFHPEVPGRWQEELTDYRSENAIQIHYCSKTFQGLSNLYLLDDRMIPLLNRDIENAWIQYLYSIFGEEYKAWYLKTREKMFN